MDGDTSHGDVTRRGVLLAGLGLALSACTGTEETVRIDRPDTPWPGRVNTPGQTHQTMLVSPTPSRPTTTRNTAPPRPTPSIHQPARSLPTTRVIDRRRWTSTAPVRRHINTMNGVRQITIHHEGWVPVFFSDEASTIDRLQKIHKVHVRDRGWADIGYHYIIDRAGRVWEGRDLRYQGAHVKNHNSHNIGIMVLGNFDKQQPSTAQTRQLVSTLRALMRQHRIAASRVRTHQEYNPTACPGRALQAQMNAIRSGSALV